MILLFSGSAIQLVPDGTLLLHLVLIVFMVILLNATLLGPINRVLEIRERRTKGRFSEAERALRNAEEKMREYERRLREARAGGYALLDEVRSAASQERERKVSSIKAELSGWSDRERENLKRDEAAARMNLMKGARSRAAEISVRILGREVSPAGQ